jgi:acetoin:2,6-dichlorophenolindophenol oxidoreductase subunit alpha
MEYTPIAAVTAVARPAADRAPAYGLPAEVIDGNDVEVVHDAVKRAADRARAGEGPTIIEAETYRHFGHSRADPAKYRPAEEVERWMQRDPLDLLRDKLAALGVSVKGVTERAAQHVEQAVVNARKAPPPDLAQALTDLWADGGVAWRT